MKLLLTLDKMPCLQMMFVIGSIISLGHFSLGIQGDKGLILGLWDPATILKITEIPIDSKSSLNDFKLPVIPSTVKITSMASDPSKSVIFIACGSDIYMAKNFSILERSSQSFSLLYDGKSMGFGQIAYDYLSRNLYWCDTLLNWIAMKPAYHHDKTIYKIVVHDDLNEPRSLAIDPENRLMFFSDNGIHPRIERASLDGQERRVIVYRGLLRVISLSVDVSKDTLYWVDNLRHTLEVCDYDGSNRRVIKRANAYPSNDLFYHQNLLYVVNAESKELYAVDVISGMYIFSKKIDSGKPYAVNVYDTEMKKSKTDSCLDLECNHMCVNTKSEPKCLCAEGFLLADDEETCTERSWFFERGFLVTDGSSFTMHEVASVNGQQRGHLQLIMFSHIKTFAVDANSDTIYFLDSKNNSLQKLNMISTKTSVLISNASGTDLTFDWIARRLGWIEAASNIQSFSITFGTIDTIYSNIQYCGFLTVDSTYGALYWISGTSGSWSIVRGTWTRDTPIVLISEANLDRPSSLQYDITNNRLYWLDGSEIKSSTTNGLDIRSHFVAIGALKAFSYKEFFGWITEENIHFTRKFSNTTEHIFETLKNAKEVVVFDPSLQKDMRGSCYIHNGGCEDICIPDGYNRQCKCDIGLQIKNDNTCFSDVLITNFILVTDFSHERMLQISLQNGSIVKLPITAQAPGIAFDKSTKNIFYSDVNEKTIVFSTLLGKNISTFYATGFSHADRLAIEYSTGNIYYSAVGKTASKSYIAVIHRSSFLHKTLLSSLVSPREVLLYASKGFLFWVEFGDMPSIGRAYMDGTAKIYITTKDLVWPNGLAIDYTSNLLYWADGYTNRIEYSDLNGGNRQVLATDTDAHLMSLVIHGQYLYYTAWNRQRITKMDKTTGSKASFMTNYPELGRLDGMDIYAGNDHLDVSSMCSNKNGFCSTFCFPTPSGRTCGCQDHVSLLSDQLTCKGVIRCPTEHPNLNLVDCPPHPGQSCGFRCKPGYRSTLHKILSCLSDGQWNPHTDTVCEAVLCPSFLENAVLSSGCQRRPGESCSFSCVQGYLPLTADNLVCTSEGRWNQDTTKLCSTSDCKTSIENGQLINCQSKNGESCQFECNAPFEKNPSVTNLMCDTNGFWNHDINNLCVKLCPSSITNGLITSDCSRQIGITCSFTCDKNYKSSISPRSISCISDGVWNRDTKELCIPIKCPLEIPSGHLSSVCRGLVGEICALYCDDKTMESVHVVCSSAGLWDEDISTICIHDNHYHWKQIKDEAINIYTFFGALAGGAIVIVVFCLQNRRH